MCETLDVCVWMNVLSAFVRSGCVCLSTSVSLSLSVFLRSRSVEKCFREAAPLSLLPPGWFPPSRTRASHTAKINEAKFQMTLDSFGQYQKVQKCDSDASFVQVIVHIPQSIAKRGQIGNLMVLRCSMVHLKSYHKLANGTHVILSGDTCPSVY